MSEAPARLSGETYAKLRAALLDGTLAPGQHLSEPELALRFSTSRSPVREALARLEHEGFVQRARTGRIIVKPLEVGDLRQLYVVRGTLEGLAARLAAPRLRTIDLEEMTAALEAMARSVASSDASGAITAGQQFHDVIIRECANEPLVEILNGLRARISRYRSVVALLGDYDEARVREHRRILDALYARDAGSAEQEVVRHVHRAAEVLIARLEEAPVPRP